MNIQLFELGMCRTLEEEESLVVCHEVSVGGAEDKRPSFHHIATVPGERERERERERGDEIKGENRKVKIQNKIRNQFMHILKNQEKR